MPQRRHIHRASSQMAFWTIVSVFTAINFRTLWKKASNGSTNDNCCASGRGNTPVAPKTELTQWRATGQWPCSWPPRSTRSLWWEFCVVTNQFGPDVFKHHIASFLHRFVQFKLRQILLSAIEIKMKRNGWLFRCPLLYSASRIIWRSFFSRLTGRGTANRSQGQKQRKTLAANTTRVCLKEI